VLQRLPPTAKFFLFHLNVSVSVQFPPGREELLAALKERGVTTLNGGVANVTKRHLQACLHAAGLPSTTAARDGNPRELVIIKSNLNHGGLKERVFTPAQRAALALPGEPPALARDRRYPIMARDQVPAWCWEDERLAIERYVTNAAGRFYRAYVAAGRLAVSEGISARRIKEMLGEVSRRNFLFRAMACRAGAAERGLPAALLPALSGAIGILRLDYGALDAIVDDEGQAFVVDVNPTPYWGAERQPDIIGLLRMEWN
jgi:hypothetical protein